MYTKWLTGLNPMYCYSSTLLMLITKVESIMLQNLLIMLLAFSQFSAYYAHFYAF